MVSTSFKIGSCLLCVDQEVRHSCLSIYATEEILLTPHGASIPVFYRALEKWQQGKSNEELIHWVWDCRDRGSTWENMSYFRGSGKDGDSPYFWLCCGPVSVYLTQQRIGEIFTDLKAVLAAAKLKPDDFAPNVKWPESPRPPLSGAMYVAVN